MYSNRFNIRAKNTNYIGGRIKMSGQINLYFTCKASQDFSRFLNSQILNISQGNSQSFDLIDCFVGSRDETSEGEITYTLHIGLIKIKEDSQPTKIQQIKDEIAKSIFRI